MKLSPRPGQQYSKTANHSQSQRKSHFTKVGSRNQAFPTQCRHCESENLEIHEGKGPHAAGVWCGDCESFQKWLSKSIAASLGIAGDEF